MFLFTENFEENFNDDEKLINFHRGTQKEIKKDFCLTNTGCFICQENFQNEEDFTKHIEYHGEQSGFRIASNYQLM